MLKKFAPIALALSLTAGALPAAAEVYQAGTRQASEFAQQHLAGVYKFQKVYAFGQLLDPGMLRVAMDAEGNMLFAQNDKPIRMALQSVDTDNNSANLIDELGGLRTFRNLFGVASLTADSGSVRHATFVRALAPQDIAMVERAYGVAAPAQPAAPARTPSPAPASPAVSAGPSFDCAKASTAIEGMICGSPELAELDGRLAEAYREVRQRADDPEVEKRGQVKWVREVRGACKTVQCLQDAYAERVNDLELLAQYLSKPREFR